MSRATEVEKETPPQSPNESVRATFPHQLHHISPSPTCTRRLNS